MVARLVLYGLLAAEDARAASPCLTRVVGLGYEALLEAAASCEGLQQYSAAVALLDGAIRREPERPEAYLARGKDHLLTARYDAATADFRRALARQADRAETQELLASSLYLSGRNEEALGLWNTLGRPILADVRIVGLAHTKEAFVRRELRLKRGDLAKLEAVRLARTRLQEVGFLGPADLEIAPLPDGRADLVVNLAEQHGFHDGLAPFLATTALQAFNHRIALRYANISGTGVVVRMVAGMQDNWSLVRGASDWPRPFGLPAVLRLRGFWEKQLYEADAAEAERTISYGGALRLRSALTSHTTGEIEVSVRKRRAWIPEMGAGPLEDAGGIEVGLERTLLGGTRHHLGAGLRAFRTVSALGADLMFPTATAQMNYRLSLSGLPEPRAHSAVATRVLLGWAGKATPVEMMYAPGASADMEYALRGHYQRRDGKLGAAPLGRSLALANVEWRQTFFSAGAGYFGLAIFYDTARVGDRPGSRQQAVWLHDVGLGLRLGGPNASLIRLDYGRSLSGKGGAVSVGLGQAF